MKKVIIVEDNPTFKKGIIDALRNHFKCEIYDLPSSERAIKEVSKDDFDLLILDGNLGTGGHGSVVLAVLNEEQIQKTIICSGHLGFIQDSLKKGITTFMAKHDDQETMKGLLSQHLQE